MSTHTRTRGIRASNWAAPTNLRRPGPALWTGPVQAPTKPGPRTKPVTHRLVSRKPGPEPTRRPTQGLGYRQHSPPKARTWVHDYAMPKP